MSDLDERCLRDVEKVAKLLVTVKPRTPRELLSVLRETDYGEETVRLGMWRLVERGVIDFGADRILRMADSRRDT